MLSLRRTRAVARKEWIQLRRDPRSMVLAFGMPVLMLVFFGYAISWDIRDMRLAVLDHDRTAHSRRLVEAFESSGYFSVALRPETVSRIDHELMRGRITGGLIIPPGFARDLAAGRPAAVQLLLDGGDANTATVALNYGSAIAAGFSRQVLLQGRAIEPAAVAETRVWYNPTLESSNMIVPGLIAVIMTIIAAMLTALTIAREWERGTMEQLAATPVHRLEIVFGKLLPYLAIGMLDVAMTVAAGVIIFDVPLRGSILLLAVMTLLFLLGALGLGMFISAVLKTQVLATQIAMVATYLPALLLSGFLFDIASMPPVLRAVSYVVPARYYIGVTRGVFLKDVGLDVLWVQGLSMIVFASVGLALATVAFDKRITA
jgi:ABC-2 type transport system permease protein